MSAHPHLRHITHSKGKNQPHTHTHLTRHASHRPHRTPHSAQISEPSRTRSHIVSHILLSRTRSRKCTCRRHAGTISTPQHYASTRDTAYIHMYASLSAHHTAHTAATPRINKHFPVVTPWLLTHLDLSHAGLDHSHATWSLTRPDASYALTP